MNGTTNGDGASPGVVTTAEAEGPKGETPAAITKADFDRWADAFASKINGEQAALRKRIEGSKAGGETPPVPATIDDVKLFREIGKMEAQLGDDLIADLGEEYTSATPAEQTRMLRLAAKLSARKPAAETAGQSSRGETPVSTQNARGMAPVSRSAIPRPRTQTEFAVLQKKDPQAARELILDNNFNLAALPFR